MKRVTLFSLLMLLTACGGQLHTSSTLSAKDARIPQFVFACTAAVPEGATLRSLRVFVDHDAASSIADYFNGDVNTSDAEGSVVIQNSTRAFAAAWTGTSFSVEQIHGRIYKGSYTTEDGTASFVRCIRVETSDRDADEFSLICAPSRAGELTTATPHELYLTYEDGELEMFVNPTSNVDIFDLELATDVRVSEYYVTAQWVMHKTSFTAEILNEQQRKFAALLSYRWTGTYAFTCWKI